MTKTEKAEQKEKAIEYLREYCPVGTRVFTVLRHVATSGMARWLDAYVMIDNEPIKITHLLGRAGIGGDWCDRRQALKVGGCGMDMGYHVVNCLSYALHGYENEGLKEEENGRFISNPTPERYKAGYTLDHRWM